MGEKRYMHMKSEMDQMNDLLKRLGVDKRATVGDTTWPAFYALLSEIVERIERLEARDTSGQSA